MKTKMVIALSVLLVAAAGFIAADKNAPHSPSDLRDAVSDLPNGAIDSLKSTGGGLEVKDGVSVSPVTVVDVTGHRPLEGSVLLTDLKAGNRIFISKKLSRRIAKALDRTGGVMYANGKEVSGLFSALYAAGQAVAENPVLRYAQIRLYWPKFGDKCTPPENKGNIIAIAGVRLETMAAIPEARLEEGKQTVQVVIDLGGANCLEKISFVKAPSGTSGATISDLEAAFGGELGVQR